MLKRKEIVEEIKKLKENFIDIKDELNTLKNRVRAYKGWTKKYRQKQKKLEQETVFLKNANKRVCRQRDLANQEFSPKQQDLLKAVVEAKQATEARDKAILELDKVIAKIEEYKGVCERANQITYADKFHLIREAEKLFFDEEIIIQDFKIDPREKPQMFTDQASIGRSLLDR